MRTFRRLHGPAGLTLTLDCAEIYPEDPGMGTPALVEVVRGRTTASGTFWCALDTGEVDGTVDLTPHQLLWLSEQHDTVEAFIQHWTAEARREMAEVRAEAAAEYEALTAGIDADLEANGEW